MKATLLFIAMTLVSTSVFAGAKEDFIAAVVKSCGKSQAEAEKLATPGRAGNIIKYQTCSSSSVDIEGCAVACASSSKIGN